MTFVHRKGSRHLVPDTLLRMFETAKAEPKEAINLIIPSTVIETGTNNVPMIFWTIQTWLSKMID